MRSSGNERLAATSHAALANQGKPSRRDDTPFRVVSGHAWQHGLTLVEVLVSLLVLSVGLLALAALQSHSMKATYSAYLRTQASQFAYDILDRMRANREAARAEAYDLALTDATPLCGATSPLVDCDRAEWRADLANLPNGNGAIDYDPATEQVTVLVQWNDESAGGSTTTSFILQSQL